MNTNVFTDTAAPAETGSSIRGLIVAMLTALLLVLRRYLKRKAAAPTDPLGRAEFCAELRGITGLVHTDHLALLEKLEANHREMLAALERQGTRIGTLEAGFARLDERTSR